MSVEPPFIPTISNPSDCSNFAAYPDSDTKPNPLKKSEDPFLDW